MTKSASKTKVSPMKEAVSADAPVAGMEPVLDTLFGPRPAHVDERVWVAMAKFVQNLGEEELTAFRESVQEPGLLAPFAEFYGLTLQQSSKAAEAEAKSILARINGELAAEEALTRQLMIRHGL